MNQNKHYLENKKYFKIFSFNSNDMKLSINQNKNK